MKKVTMNNQNSKMAENTTLVIVPQELWQAIPEKSQVKVKGGFYWHWKGLGE